MKAKKRNFKNFKERYAAELFNFVNVLSARQNDTEVSHCYFILFHLSLHAADFFAKREILGSPKARTL